MQTTVATGILRPRMQGTPPSWLASAVIRVNAIFGHIKYGGLRLRKSLCPPRNGKRLAAASVEVTSSRDARADVLSQDAVDQRLVPDVAAPGFCAEAFQHIRIEPDRNELPSVGSDWRPPDTSHPAKLFV